MFLLRQSITGHTNLQRTREKRLCTKKLLRDTPSFTVHQCEVLIYMCACVHVLEYEMMNANQTKKWRDRNGMNIQHIDINIIPISSDRPFLGIYATTNKHNNTNMHSGSLSTSTAERYAERDAVKRRQTERAIQQRTHTRKKEIQWNTERYICIDTVKHTQSGRDIVKQRARER